MTEVQFKPGDVVFRSEPWVFSVLATKAHLYCYRCLKQPGDLKDLRKCTGCYFAHYCGPECQRRFRSYCSIPHESRPCEGCNGYAEEQKVKADWADRHKAECNVLRQVGNDGVPQMKPQLDRLLILSKIIHKLKRGEHQQPPEECNPPSSRSYHDLMSHKDDYIHEKKSELSNDYEVLKPYLDQLESKESKSRVCGSFEAFVEMLGKFNINNFSIYAFEDPVTVTVGRGLYLGPSVIDHSCIPNALHCDVGKSVVIRAIRSIKHVGETRISYVSPFETLNRRRSILKKQYFFTCLCPGCSDEKTKAERAAVKCPNRKCSNVLGHISNRLPLCVDLPFGMDEIKDMANGLGQQLDASSNTCGESRLAQMESTIADAEKVLHSSNFHLGVACQKIAERLLEQGVPLLAAPYFAKALLPRRVHVGDITYSWYVLVLRWLIEEQKFQEATLFMNDTAERLSVVPGPQSVLYKSWCKHVAELAE